MPFASGSPCICVWPRSPWPWRRSWWAGRASRSCGTWREVQWSAPSRRPWDITNTSVGKCSVTACCTDQSTSHRQAAPPLAGSAANARGSAAAISGHRRRSGSVRPCLAVPPALYRRHAAGNPPLAASGCWCRRLPRRSNAGSNRARACAATGLSPHAHARSTLAGGRGRTTERFVAWAEGQPWLAARSWLKWLSRSAAAAGAAAAAGDVLRGVAPHGRHAGPCSAGAVECKRAAAVRAEGSRYLHGQHASIGRSSRVSACSRSPARCPAIAWNCKRLSADDRPRRRRAAATCDN